MAWQRMHQSVVWPRLIAKVVPLLLLLVVVGQVNKTLHRRLPGRYSETPDVLLLNTGMVTRDAHGTPPGSSSITCVGVSWVLQHDFITERSGHEDLFERFPWSARPFTKHNFTFAQHKQVLPPAHPPSATPLSVLMGCFF